MRKKKTNSKAAEEKIGSILQRRLMILLLISFAIASFAGLTIQNHVQHRQSFTLVNEYLDDFFSEWDFDVSVKEEESDWMKDSVETAGRETFSNNDLLKRYVKSNALWTTELDLVDENGIVRYSSNPDMIGYDLRDSDDTASFLCLLDGEDYYAMPLYPNPFEADPSLKMSYVGCAFADHKGMLLIGINEENWRKRVSDEIYSLVVDGRIGVTGYLVAVDPGQNVIASAYMSGVEQGSPFERPDLLPQEEDIRTETITEIYGKKSYVTAVKKGDLYVVGVYPTEEADQLRKQENVLFIVLFFVSFSILTLVLSFFVRSHVIRQVEDIHESLNKITEGDLNEKVDVGGSLEFSELSVGINDTVDHLKDRIEQEKEALAKKMENARKIQESAVPDVFPKNESFGLFALMDTAEAVGGDFYDFYLIGKDTLVFVMADVAGKGMPAALYMMRAKTLIKTYAEQGLPVEQVAEKTNQALCEDNASAMFVTAWIGFLDLKTGKISYVDAGHTYPILVGEDVSFVRKKVNMVLGGVPASEFMRQEVILRPGDSIFLYTDGVTEAEDPDRKRYGEERLLSLICDQIKNPDTSDDQAFCKAGCQMVMEDVERFSSGADQFDDITMMWIKYSKPASKDTL